MPSQQNGKFMIKTLFGISSCKIRNVIYLFVSWNLCFWFLFL